LMQTSATRHLHQVTHHVKSKIGGVSRHLMHLMCLMT
jgi:hypothetical protein